MTPHKPQKHHYVPQFFLKNFAIDAEKTKVAAVTKHGHRAVWSETSIKSIGFEEDYYVHFDGGIPVSVEPSINKFVETPISQSETWKKISTGSTESLDKSDKPILYALIRHLQTRTPLHRETRNELAQKANDPNNDILFSDEERNDFAFMRNNPEQSKAMLNLHLTFPPIWGSHEYKESLLTVHRSPISLYSSTTPVMSLGVPPNEAISYSIPGMTPFQWVISLNPTTIATLTLGNFNGAFINCPLTEEQARGFNRHYVAYFAYFSAIQHLIAGRHNIIEEMTWASYDLINDTQKAITFIRRN